MNKATHSQQLLHHGASRCTGFAFQFWQMLQRELSISQPVEGESVANGKSVQKDAASWSKARKSGPDNGSAEFMLFIHPISLFAHPCHPTVHELLVLLLQLFGFLLSHVELKIQGHILVLDVFHQLGLASELLFAVFEFDGQLRHTCAQLICAFAVISDASFEGFQFLQCSVQARLEFTALLLCFGQVLPKLCVDSSGRIACYGGGSR